MESRSAKAIKNLAVYSHDVDFVILMDAYADLRDIEAVHRNNRLNRHEFMKNGVAFDVYVQFQNNLRIPADAIVACSTLRQGLRVSSLEHLLLLKADAFKDRKLSGKGEKDAQDLLRLLYLMESPDPATLKGVTSDDIELIESAIKQDNILPLVDRNAHMAKTIHQKVTRTWSELKEIQRGFDHDRYTS